MVEPLGGYKAANGTVWRCSTFSADQHWPFTHYSHKTSCCSWQPTAEGLHTGWTCYHALCASYIWSGRWQPSSIEMLWDHQYSHYCSTTRSLHKPTSSSNTNIVKKCTSSSAVGTVSYFMCAAWTNLFYSSALIQYEGAFKCFQGSPLLLSF